MRDFYQFRFDADCINVTYRLINGPKSFDTLLIQQFSLRFLLDGPMLSILTKGFLVLSIGGSIEG